MVDLDYLEKVAKKNIIGNRTSAALVGGGIAPTALSMAYLTPMYGQDNYDPTNTQKYDEIMVNQGFKSIGNNVYSDGNGNTITINNHNKDADIIGPHFRSVEGKDNEYEINMSGNMSNSPEVFAHESGHASRVVLHNGPEQYLEMYGAPVGSLVGLGGLASVVANERDRNNKLKKAKNKNQINSINNKYDKQGLRYALVSSGISGAVTLPGEIAASASGSMALPEDASFLDHMHPFVGVPTYALAAAAPLMAYGAARLKRKYDESNNKL